MLEGFNSNIVEWLSGSLAPSSDICLLDRKQNYGNIEIMSKRHFLRTMTIAACTIGKPTYYVSVFRPSRLSNQIWSSFVPLIRYELL